MLLENGDGVPHEKEKSGDKSRVLVEEADLSVPEKTKGKLVRRLEKGRRPGPNEGNGPHPAESLPSAGDDVEAIVGRRISRFPVVTPMTG